MSNRPDPMSILGDISLLYELSLSSGHSLDPIKNCDRFLHTLMGRKNLGFASVWVRGEAIDADDPDELLLLYANPAFRTRETTLPPDHPVLADIPDSGRISVTSIDPAFPRYVTEGGLTGGSLALFRLGEIGLLKLHSATRTEPFAEREMNQLWSVVDKFAVSLEGCLAHRRAVREIERRRAAESALRESEERYRALFEHNPSMYFTLDEEGRVLAVNGFGAAELGWDRNELIGRSVLEVFHEEDRENVARQLKLCLSQPDTTFEWRFRKKTRSGETIWVQEYARSIRGPDGKYQVLIVCQNVTERLRAESERQEIERQLQYAQKLESLGVLAGGIAHDFNNILTGVLGNAGLARLELPSGSSADRFVEQAERAAMRAADLCRQLLAYSGRGQFESRPVDLTDEIREALELLKVSVARTITLDYELADGLPRVHGDPTQLRQVIVNLLTNASDAIGGKSGSIRLRTGALDCDAAYLAEGVSNEALDPGRYVFFEVEDTGRGMTEETVARIFDPFFTTKFSGRGLGLAAVLGIVRGHRGTIRIRTREGEGTVFRVLLPSSTERLASEVERGSVLPTRSAGGTVLLVDDEDVVRQVGTRALERLGYIVVTARDGVEAIEVFRERGREIDVVILDLTMPRLDGVRTIEELRQLGTDVPVVLSSGFDEAEAAERLESQDVTAFLRKPYPIEELAKTVREAIRTRERPSRPR